MVKARRLSDGPSAIEVLRRQEMAPYYQCKRDYLRHQDAAADTRKEMLEWVCSAAEFMKLGNDVSIITCTLLDRFLQTSQGSQILESVPDFRLATMACLYLTAKVHDQSGVILSSHVMSKFSQGMFSARQVEEMELLILVALEWHCNPPTALDFVREFLLLLPCSVSQTIKDQALQLCHAQIQHSMLDYEIFACKNASTLAFFAVQNALRVLGMDSILLGHVAAIFSYASHTDYQSSQTQDDEALQASLYQSLYKKNSNKRQHNSNLKRSTNKKKKSSSTTKASSKSRKYWTSRATASSLDDSPYSVVWEATR